MAELRLNGLPIFLKSFLNILLPPLFFFSPLKLTPGEPGNLRRTDIIGDEVTVVVVDDGFDAENPKDDVSTVAEQVSSSESELSSSSSSSSIS